MTIIACPECGKRMSSNAPLCDYCGHQAGEVDEAALQRHRGRRLRRRIYRLKMLTYAAMAIVVLAICWYWVESGGFFLVISHRGPAYLFIAGGLFYVGVRVLLVRARRELKANRNPPPKRLRDYKAGPG